MCQCLNLLHPEGAETLQNTIKQRFSCSGTLFIKFVLCAYHSLFYFVPVCIAIVT